MKLIQFPGRVSPVAANPTLDPTLRMSIGPIAFTCTACGEHTTVNFHRMVFRSLEFYCLGCGNPFRIVNPAFAAKKT